MNSFTSHFTVCKVIIFRIRKEKIFIFFLTKCGNDHFTNCKVTCKVTCKAIHVHFTDCKVNFLNIMNDTLRTVDFQTVNERCARDFEAHLLFATTACPDATFVASKHSRARWLARCSPGRHFCGVQAFTSSLADSSCVLAAFLLRSGCVLAAFLLCFGCVLAELDLRCCFVFVVFLLRFGCVKNMFFAVFCVPKTFLHRFCIVSCLKIDTISRPRSSPLFQC